MAAWEWRRQEPDTAALIQPSKLLSGLFRDIDEDRRLMVLHIGAAAPETLDFFARYRCRLHVNDLFQKLPFSPGEESEAGASLEQQFASELQFSPDTQFDICLFWDFFNYLDAAGISALLSVLAPHLHASSMAHGFAIHNRKAAQVNQRYGISDHDALSVRQRTSPLPGYTPHSQNELKTMLHCFNLDRQVLLTDSRLELLLRAKPAS
jgi:hypothetical protein